MVNQPLVSVIMPFYNGHTHIAESVTSVLAQTYKNFELVIVNDGSHTPTSQEILSNLDCSKITFIDHGINKGLAAARNTAFAQANGEFIVPLDCDDRIAPTFIEETAQVLSSDSQVDAVYTQVQIFGDLNLTWIPEATMTNLMAGLPIPSTTLFRRHIFDLVGGFNTRIRYVPDCDFWLRVLSKDGKLRRIEKLLYHYRKHANSLSELGKFTEVVVLAEANKQLYFDNLTAVLAAGEHKYYELKAEYAKLETGYRQLDEGYKDLLRRYDETVAQLQKRSIRHQLGKLTQFTGNLNK